MANYLDRNEFHREMTLCKRKNELSKRAIEMLNTLATEVSRKYYFEDAEDYKDAAASAVYDLVKYWRGFKENPVVQLEICRNFIHGEKLIIKINGMPDIVCMAVDDTPYDKKKNVLYFSIGDSANRSLTNLSNLLKVDKLGVFLDRVKCKITFMDNLNLDPDYTTYNSSIEFVPLKTGMTYAYNEKGKNLMENVKIDGKMIKRKVMVEGKMPISNTKFHLVQNMYTFKEPPNSFSYFTSVCSNGCLKFIDKRNPKALRNGKLLTIGIHNTETFFNI